MQCLRCLLLGGKVLLCMFGDSKRQSTGVLFMSSAIGAWVSIGFGLELN